MNYGLYLSAAEAKAQLARQSVITNNLANANTSGFKRDLVVMQSRMNASYEDPMMLQYRMPVVKDIGGGVDALGDGIDLSQSAIEETGNPTDLAISGRGFFMVQAENGEKLLTRDGRFMLDQDGRLLTVAAGNRPVLSSAGVPVVVDPNQKLRIDPDGTVWEGAEMTDKKVALTDVSDPRYLVKVGGNLLKNNGEMKAAGSDVKILQRKLENSGVDPMLEIVTMMEGQRAFEANTKMIQLQDTTLSQLNTVGRVA